MVMNQCQNCNWCRNNAYIIGGIGTSLHIKIYRAAGMAQQMVSILVLALVLTTAHSTQPTNGGSAGRVAQFGNGFKFDLDSLLEGLKKLAESELQAKPTGVRFQSADRSILRSEAEQNFRNIFGRSSGNKYVDSANASKAATSDEQLLKAVVSRTGINPKTSFNADGYPTDAGIKKISSSRVKNCPYDRANSEPCSSKFREPTGRCSNRLPGKKTWGMAGTPYTRLLAASYEDGVGERRKTGAKSGRVLKSPREISTLVSTNNVVLDGSGVNAQVMQWGQYISHEITQLGESSADAACCPDQIFKSRHGATSKPTKQQLEQIRQEISRFRGDVCMQVEMDKDPVYGGYVCMAQTRSRPAPLHDCSLGPRQQMNTITHVFDGSGVYGSSKSEQDKLRVFSGGRMKTQTVNGVVLPPPNLNRCSAIKKAANRCPFLGGDSRINTTPNLISTHTAALVKHNHIVAKLSAINRHWDDERLFQEARRIIAGIEASIHYYEYVPLIIGSQLVNKYSLGTYAGFDPNVNPSVLSELAHAAMRFGHSTVGGFFSVLRDNGTSGFEDLKPLFGNSDFVYNGGTRQCVRGLMGDLPWKVDRNFPEQMRDFLFNEKRDIISMNINRGRDHGFLPYVEYRKHYGLSVPLTFDDLAKTHPPKAVQGLRAAYASVGDMELYIAGVTEKRKTGALVGELFGNILGDGFLRMLKGDRLFFESPHSGLSRPQIAAIRAYKYHQLLCEGSGLRTISDNAFHRAGSLGAKTVTCSSLTPLNLNLWKESIVVSTNCDWQVTNTSPCCFSAKVVTRKCVKNASCKCVGSTTIERPCICAGGNCYTNIMRSCRHLWVHL